PRDGEAGDAQRGRHHRQGLRAGAPHRRRGAMASGRGERAARDPGQVGARGRSALMSDAVPAARLTAARRVSFVTGSLAEPSLRRVLAGMSPPFAYDVAVMKITVAALMTTEWIGRRLTVPDGTDLVLIPGLCEGDPALVANAVGVPVEKGPKDLREIPAHFGRVSTSQAYGDYDIEILAEINNAPR